MSMLTGTPLSLKAVSSWRAWEVFLEKGIACIREKYVASLKLGNVVRGIIKVTIMFFIDKTSMIVN